MKKLTIIALFATLGLVSCKDTKAEATTTETTAETTETPEATPAQAESHEGHDHSHEGHNHGPEGHTETASAQQAQGMNPPHGQPGHRCDIPVGAPLDSPPQRQVPTQQAAPASNGQGFLGGGTQQAAAPQQPQAMPVQETAPGMKGKPNPAHGQPGHRCDISVGQPLP